MVTKFGILGSQPHGLQLAEALAQRSDFQLAAYAGPEPGTRWLAERGFLIPTLRDPEELLARRDVELVLVADDPEHRPQLLRRAAQSDKHVVCIHPPDVLPDVTYEAALSQQETRKILLPALPARLSPGIQRSQELLRAGQLGKLQMIEGEVGFPPVANATWSDNPLAFLWDVLRALGGEVRDVACLTTHGEVMQPGDAATLTGHFEREGMFQLLLTPRAEAARTRLQVRGESGQLELEGGPLGFKQLAWRTATATGNEEWPEWDPWSALAEAIHRQLHRQPAGITWLDATRCLELFEATRQSAKKKRLVPMQYEEFSEAANFKGVMAAGGCLVLLGLAALLAIMLILGLPLKPWFFVVSLPVLAIFLGMQLLRWIVPEEKPPAPPTAALPEERIGSP